VFRINEVFRFDGKLYRVLANLPEQQVWISLDDEAALPSLIPKSALANAIDSERIIRADDPYEKLHFLLLEEDSPIKVKRDKNYDLIKPIILNPHFYVPEIRASIMNRLIAEQGSTKQTFYRLLRRYWQRGQMPNALLPDYVNSGGKGKKRSADKKLGRPRKLMPGIGAVIDAHIEKLFRIAIDRYLLTDKKHSFPYAHRKFKSLYETYYPETPESEIPTNWQMLHFFQTRIQPGRENSETQQ